MVSSGCLLFSAVKNKRYSRKFWFVAKMNSYLGKFWLFWLRRTKSIQESLDFFTKKKKVIQESFGCLAEKNKRYSGTFWLFWLRMKKY